MSDKLTEDKETWYTNSKAYWEEAESTVTAVLGGNDSVNDSDVKTSKEFLQGLINNNKIKTDSVIDCGAGIGRVTDQVLQHYFNEIDLVEQDPKYIEYCKNYFRSNAKIKNIYESALQNFKFEKKYDIVWIQWCLENLDDFDLENFLNNCKTALNESGNIIIKENIVSKGTEYRPEDCSRIRSDVIFKQIFDKCGLQIKKHFHQPNWPKDFLKVSVFMLEPIKNLI